MYIYMYIHMYLYSSADILPQLLLLFSRCSNGFEAGPMERKS